MRAKERAGRPPVDRATPKEPERLPIAVRARRSREAVREYGAHCEAVDREATEVDFGVFAAAAARKTVIVRGRNNLFNMHAPCKFLLIAVSYSTQLAADVTNGSLANHAKTTPN